MKPLIALILFTFSFNVIAKVRYVQSPPLKSFVKTSVQSCGVNKTLQVPLITWGGDIPTIFANGNQAKTANNSIFQKNKLDVKLVREDVFSKQVENLLTCKSPFIRGTMGMVNLAKDVTDLDPRTKLKVIYQMTWSAGGDALVVKSNIKSAKDLKGKTIAVQAYGPHVDYLAKILSNAGLTVKDVKIKWTKDLTGTQNTPVEAFRESGIDAAMVIIPDALALSSNGNVGTGSEDSVKGAKILLSTKTSNRVIADVYAVRSDFFEAHKTLVSNFVYSLLKAQEEVSFIMKNEKTQDYAKLVRSAAEILLDSPTAVGDTKGMYLDAEFVGYPGNEKFFANSKYPRNFEKLTAEIQKAFVGLGLLSTPSKLEWADWNFKTMKSGLKNVVAKTTPKFDAKKVEQVIKNKVATKTLDDDVLYGVAAYFAPKQSSVPLSKYRKEFDKIIDLVATNGGAILTVEGHTDPSHYQKRLEKNALQVELNGIRQGTKNLSKRRANAFRDSLISYARTRGVSIDPSQITTVGHGVNNPKFPRPKTKEQWNENRRVEFRMINVETESDVFVPFN
jgi:ABC-type nitrate/sulfonate/bicarbonate transport system substrate-binding protein/outer membrane protein OmpA-like peptidoglycan-associated protein